MNQRIDNADHHRDSEADHERGDGVDFVDGGVLRKFFQDVNALRVDAARVDKGGERQIRAARRQSPACDSEASGTLV